MALDAASQLGGAIADISNKQEKVEQNLTGEDSGIALPVRFNERIGVGAAGSYYQKNISPTAFVIDHVVLGDIDSSTLYIDGGYMLNTEVEGTILQLDLEASPDAGVAYDVRTLSTGTANNATYKIGASAYYPFNGDANDESVNNNDGVVTGATLTTDHLGNSDNAYLFSGAESINCGSIDLGSFSAFSLWTWIKHSSGSVSGNESIMGNLRYSTAANNTGGLYINSFGKFALRLSDGTTGKIITQNSTISTDWTHVVATWDGTTMKLYINGVLQTNTDTLSSVNSLGYDFVLGATYAESSTFLNATLSEAGVLNKALTQTEVSTLYSVTSAHKLTSPLVTKTDSEGNSITGYECAGLQYLEMGSFGSQIGGTHTVLLELYANSFPSTYSCLIGNGSARLQIANNGKVFVDDWGFASADSAGNAGDITVQTVHRLILELDDSTTTANLNVEVDGVQVATADVSGAGSFGTDWYIGAFNTTPTNPWDGVISKPLIVNRWLTTEEKTAYFNGEIPRKLLYTGTI